MTAIHETAIVDSKAQLGDGVEVGPYCVIGPNVAIGGGTRIMAHAFLEGYTTIGRDCSIFPGACIGTQTQDLKYKGAKSFVEIGDRTVLRECVTVNSSTEEGEVTRVGSGCFLMAYSHVAHKCSVGDGVIMANASQLAGHVIVEDFANIGGVVGVHQFCRIGTMAFVGSSSKVAQDVPPYLLVEGNPAEVHGVNAVGLQRRGVPEGTRILLKHAFRLLYRSDLSTRQALDRIRGELTMCPELEHFIKFIENSERGIIK